MRPRVRISGIGSLRFVDHEPREIEARLQAALRPAGSPPRLLHRIEEVAFLAAHQALAQAGRSTPVAGDGIGLALGVEEGIDGIKARYFEGVLRDGPLGASPMVFPLTTPNTVAARISILLDLRGESFTVCGGGLSGAHAIGLAVQALRDRQTDAMLAGGTTAVEREFLTALHEAGRGMGGEPGCGACLFLLERDDAGGVGGAAGSLLGYATGFGKADVLDAIRGCLDDAEIPPAAIDSVWLAAVHDRPTAVEAVSRAGVQATIVRSDSSGLHSAAFPLAVAEAVGQAARQKAALVVGSDCLAGAAAAVVQREA